MSRTAKGRFVTVIPHRFARGATYCGVPLQSDGQEFLCPDCGGYGYVADDNCGTCPYCVGTGALPLHDQRVTEGRPL
jgi:hypothetical protein